MSATDQIQIEFANRISELPGVSEKVRSFFENQSLDQDSLYAFDVALEELLTNVVKYAHNDGERHLIRVMATSAPEHATIEVIDDGLPFDPTTAAPPDLSLSIDDIPIGGLGLHLVRSMVESISYERRENCNHVLVRVGRVPVIDDPPPLPPPVA